MDFEAIAKRLREEQMLVDNAISALQHIQANGKWVGRIPKLLADVKFIERGTSRRRQPEGRKASMFYRFHA